MTNSMKAIAIVGLAMMIGASAANAQTHFTFTTKTGNNATVGVPTICDPNIAGQPLVGGDEIGAFTPAGLCVGAIVWTGINTTLTVWGDDAMTPGVIDGLVVGEVIHYRLWSASTNTEYPVGVVKYSQGNGAYVVDGRYILSELSTIPLKIVRHTITGFNINTVTQKYSFDIYSMSTGLQSVRVGSTSYYLFFNHVALSSPVLSNINPKYTTGSPTGDYNAMTVAMVSGEIVVTISYGAVGGGGTGDVLSPGNPMGERICTVTLDIVQPIASSGLSWDTINSFMTTPSADPITNQFAGSDDTPLPVELVSFTVRAVPQAVHVSWTTATEVNCFGFEIQRSAGDRSNWQWVGFLEGAGTVNAEKTYSYYDRNNAAGTFSYRLKQIDRDGKFFYSRAVEVVLTSMPSEFGLDQNHPNPFNPTTSIGFDLPEESYVDLTVYNIIGQEVARLVNSVLPAGHHAVSFDASALPSGMYFYRLDAGPYTSIKKMTLLK
jgi:hypothetical protein